MSWIERMQGVAAPPRHNGELVFEAPWQGRVFVMAIAVQDRLGLQWDDFRAHLIAEIERAPDRHYYESWLAAIEAQLAARGLADPGVLPELNPS